MLVLSVDVGLVKPGFVLLDSTPEGVKISVYRNLTFKNITESVPVLNHLSNKELDHVIIEHQSFGKNTNFASFLHGFFLAKNISVIFKQPFASLRHNKEKKTRSEKKQFSVDFTNDILEKSGLSTRFCQNNSDFCDAINIGLSFLFSLKKSNYLSVNIKILSIIFIDINVEK